MKSVIRSVRPGRRRAAAFGLLLVLLLGATAVSVCLPASAGAPAPGGDPLRGEKTVKGVWINYMEFAAMMDGQSESAFHGHVDETIGNVRSLGLNTVFLHVRSHSDSLYPSTLFPWSVRVNGGQGVDYDPLAYFIRQAHAAGIAVHGWINPYRISTGSLAQLRASDPAYAMRQDGNCVVERENGVYYNPAAPRVRSLILSGVRELLETYDLDGIQYDDYFYPTDDPSFDRVAYQQYCDGVTHPMALADWRRCQVNLLIEGTCQLAHAYGVVFGVSPAADLQKNRDVFFADVTAWAAGGYVDYLCPQLYFGFHYPKEAFRFDRLLTQWQETAGDVPLYVGLASYKVGQTDAGSGEWVTATDLLARQADLAASLAGAQGICLYHYTSLFASDPVSAAQREALAQALARLP